jgi:Protein of unknown function (DUF3180)
VSHDPELRPDGTGPGGPETPEPAGRVRPTGAGTVVGTALVGLVLGWLLRPVSVWAKGSAPTVGWLPVGTLTFVALVIGSVAWSTYRLVHRRRGHLEPHRAVNRLVMAKTCAVVGSLFAGGYFGYALSWIGLTDAALARQRVVHSVVAGVAAVLLVVGSLLLERACRVHSDDR